MNDKNLVQKVKLALKILTFPILFPTVLFICLLMLVFGDSEKE